MPAPSPDDGNVPSPPSRLKRLLRLPFEIILVPLILLDELARPIYRPLLRWIASWRIMHRLDKWIGALHPLAILMLLAIPFAFAEPMKVVSLLWIADGHFKTGTVTLVLAYLMSFVIVERIYHAGRDKLLTIGWFAWAMGIMVSLRATLLDWVHQTALWQAAKRIKDRVVATVRGWLKD